MYEASKLTLKKQSRADMAERILWHGTSDNALDSICQYGFNRAYCGKNGNVAISVFSQFTKVGLFVTTHT